MRQTGRGALAPAQALQHALDACRRGDWQSAERLCRALLAARPDHFEALFLLGVAAGRAGRPRESAQVLARAVALDPQHAEAHFNRGVALAALGRHDDANQSYERALSLQPAYVEAHFNRAVSLGALGRHEEALASYARAIALRPHYAEAHHNQGIALMQLGRAAEALASFERALSLSPQYARAFNNRGVALAALGRLAEALESYDRALALKPDSPDAWNNRAIALIDLDRAAEAAASCDRALALKPDFADAFYNRGNALRDLDRHANAVSAYERAIALDPLHASAHWNLADCLLLMGDFARGWQEYAWRWKPGVAAARRQFAAPLWLGGDDPAGRTILLHSELGFGDTLQFCRYAPLLARRGARVLMEVPQPLVALLGTLDGVAEVLAAGSALPAFDCHCPLMSLPFAFRTDLANVPREMPYLRSDPARVAAWRERLGPARKPRVGIAWSGSVGLKNDKRSMALERMLPLIDERAEWVSLHKELREADAALLAARPDIRHFGAQLDDFAATAALAELMDLVITVDTSVAHVAGALAKPVWILLALHQHDWRWLLEREDSVWYPSARLFRQRAAGDWEDVVRRVAQALALRFPQA